MPARTPASLALAGSLLLVASLIGYRVEAGTPASSRLSAALGAASEQRVLAERITKAWCLLGLGNEDRAPRAQLFDAIERFEALLAELDGELADTPGLRPGLGDLHRRWQEFERIASSEPARDRALALLAAHDRLLAAADHLVGALASEVDTPQARALELAGRQAMLGQRLVRSYAFLAWGFDHPRIVEQFVSAWNEYETGQTALEAFPGNSPALDAALAAAAEAWGWFKGALSLYRADIFYPGIIDDSGEKVLEEVGRVRALYRRLLVETGAL